MTFLSSHMLDKVLRPVVARFMSRGLRQGAYARPKPSRRHRTAPTEPAAYPSELDGHIVLPNRRRLRIRPLRRCEEDAVRELYDHLSPRTRFLRFFSHTRLD